MRSVRLCSLLAVAIPFLAPLAHAQTGQVLFTEDLSAWQAAAGPYTNTTANYGSTTTALGGAGTITYNAGQVVTIGVSWNTWCCGYAGEAVSTDPATSTTIALSPGISAFGLQIEPEEYQLESMTVTLSNGQAMTATVNGEAGAQFFGFVGTGITSITITDNASDSFAFGNFYSGSAVIISSPTQNDTYPVGGAGYDVAGPIVFNATAANNSKLSWTVALTYTTTGGDCAQCVTSDTFQTPAGKDKDKSYTNKGGQIVATATDSLSNAASVTVYVVGTSIPTSTEVSLLDSIYSGPTSNLMSGIAQVESSTMQFAQETNFGIASYWPTESYDGGSHIGLLQLPVAMAVAWDYQTNSIQGEQLFDQKIATATRLMNKAIAAYSGLPTLTAVQLENMGLVLYGPYAAAGITNQYYVPSCSGGTAKGHTCSGGNWVWSVNTTTNPNGVAYANKCRASVQ